MGYALFASSAGATNVIEVNTTGVTATTGDLTPALLAAFNAADDGSGGIPKMVVCPPGRWRLDTNLTVTNRSINFDGQGAEFVIDNGLDIMVFDSTVSALAAVVSVTNRANYTYFGAAYSWGAQIQLADTSSINVGDVMKVVSDNRINEIAFTSDSGSVERWAEMGTVLAKDASNVWLDRCFEGKYTNNPRYCLLNKSRTFRAVNFSFTNIADVLESTNIGSYRAGITVRGYVRPYLDEIITRDLPGPSVSVVGCYMPQIGSLYGYHQQGNTSNNQVGYTLNVTSCQGGGARFVYGERVRHVVTTNAVDITANNSAHYNYGGVVDFHCGLVIGESCESFVWDQHTDAYNFTADTVICRGDFQPRAEQTGAVQFRGIKCHVEHIHCETETGYAVLWNTYSPDCTVGRITGTMAYVARGGPQRGASDEYPYARAYIGDVDASVSYGTNTFRFNVCDGLIEIGSARIRLMPNEWTPQGSLAHTIMAYQPRTNYANGRLKIGKLAVDMSNMSDASLTVAVNVLSTQNTCDRVDIGEIEIDYGAGMTDTAAEIKLISSTGTATNGWHVGKFTAIQSSEAAGAFNPPIWASGTTGQTVTFGEIEVRGTGNSVRKIGADGALSFASATQSLTQAIEAAYLLAGNTLKLGSDLGSVLTCTNAAAKVTSLQAPTYNGQRWRLACAVGSANPLVIASGQISNVGSDLSVAAANEITLTAVGGAWVKYTAA